MFSMPVRVAVFAVVLATIIAAAVQPSYAAPLSQTEARVLCVNTNGGATGAPCTNADAYSTIQAAVDAAHSGDEIRIAKGVYTEDGAASDGNVVLIDQKSLRLIGGFSSNDWTTPEGVNQTVIDGQDQVRGMTAWSGNVVLEHLTITHGKAPNADLSGSYSCSSNSGCGGAIYSYGGDVSLEDVVISENHAGKDGGGIYASTVILTDTQIMNNHANGGGGGIMGDEVQMFRSTVDGNSANGVGNLYALGGGVVARKFSTVDSVITHNTAKHAGGVAATTTVIERTRIEHNTAVLGGGLLLDGRSTVVNSVISNNAASEHGGGVYPYAGVLDVTSTVFGNNTAGIEGDAIYAGDANTSSSTGVYLRNTTIASVERAPHAAVYLAGNGTLLLFDTVITNHVVGVARSSNSWIGGDYNAFFNNGTDHTVDGTAQPLPFANLVITDPQFVDPTVGDFHLQASSPLIDQGDPKRDVSILPLDDQRDIDGEPVPWGRRADIGADEVAGTPRVFAPFVTQ